MAFVTGAATAPTDDVFLQDDLGPTIAEHALQCNQLFRKYMTMPAIVSDPTIVDDQLARFTLWASNMDVFGPLNVSLDYRLRYGPTVVDIIHQLLDVICDSLTSLRSIDDAPQTPSRKKQRIDVSGNVKAANRLGDDSSDGDGEKNQEEENVSLIVHNVGETVTRLFRLSNAVRKSAKATRNQKIGRYNGDVEVNQAVTELRLYTDCYIRFRFPQAPDHLRSVLVEANALRLRRIYYQRSHRRRTNLSLQHPETTPERMHLPKIADSAPAMRFAPIFQPELQLITTNSKQAGPPVALMTYASTTRQTAVGVLYADSSVELPRAKSVLVNNELSLPAVPTTDECPYCGVTIECKGPSKTMLWQ